MIIRGKIINTKLAEVVKSVTESLKNADLFISKEEDTAGHNLYLKPPVDLKTCKHIFDNSLTVAKCSRIKAKDVLLNEITISSDEEVNTDLIEKINECIKQYSEELYNVGVDYYYAGIGAFEFVSDGYEFRFKQIPIHTTKILRMEVGGSECYVLKQQIRATMHYFKILGENYPEGFDSYDGQKLGDCCIIGGDNFYEFFSMPLWVQAKYKIYTEMCLDEKDYDQLSKGNIASGVLHVNLEPNYNSKVSFDEEGSPVIEKNREDIITEELQLSNGGTATIFTESDKQINLDYVKLENNNYEYLLEKQDKCEQGVLTAYGIPLTRFMNNTEKESMNSNKTQSIWEIYTLDTATEQRIWKQGIIDFINYIYGINVKCDMSTPIFSDRREIEIDNVVKEWNAGFITLRESIEALAEFDKSIDLSKYDFEENPDLWNYRKLEGYYDLLSESDEAYLSSIENKINQLK